MRAKIWGLVIATALLAGCAGGFSLVGAAAPVQVAKGMTVTPNVAWNRMPRRGDQKPYEEVWTADGPSLNSITFYAGIPEGQKLIRQSKKAEDQVPVFKSTMLPQELAEFVENNYRVLSGSTAFTVQQVKPATFVGEKGFQLDFDYVLQSDEIRRKARAVGAVKNAKLYMIIYEGTATHYYPALLAEAEKIIAGAQVSAAK